MKALGCLILLAVIAIFSHPAQAKGGLCRWENGPGTDVSCKAEDCPQDGGTAICTQVEIKKPERGDNPEGFTYAMCDGSLYTSNDVKWCIAAGGTPGTGPDGAAGCDHLPAHVLGNMGQTVDEESLTRSIPDIKIGNPGCDKTTVVDSGWGKGSDVSYNCWAIHPQNINGINILDRRERAYSWHTKAQDGTCSVPSSAMVVVRRDRLVGCPAGYVDRVRPDKTHDCWRVRPCPKCVGDPVEVASGARVQREHDYDFGNSTGLSLARYYYSFGFYRPPTAPTSSLAGYSDYWRTNFDVRLYEETVGGNTVVSVVEPTGAISAFDGSGAPVSNDGSGDRVQRSADGTWARIRGSGYIDRFNVGGQLVSIINPYHDETILEYDADGHLGLVQDAFGRSLIFTYSQDRMASVMLPDGRSVSYQYDSSGRMSSVTFPDGSQRVYEYKIVAQPSLLTALVDESGMRTEFGYDSSWRSSASSVGGVIGESFTYGDSSTRHTVVDGDSTLFTFAVSGGINRPVKESRSCNGCATSEISRLYDAQGNRTQLKDEAGTLSKFTYVPGTNLEASAVEGLDSSGAVTASTRTTLTNWNLQLRKPLRIQHDAPGELSSVDAWTYDSQGAVTSRTVSYDGSEATTTYDVDLHGRVSRTDGPRTDVSDVTSYEYYDDLDPCSGCRGSLKTETDALGAKTSYSSYDANGHLLARVSPSGDVTRWEYDVRGRLTAELLSAGTPVEEATRYSVDPAGRLSKVTYPDYSSRSYKRDAAGRLVAIKYRSGAEASVMLDGLGNRIESSFKDSSGSMRAMSRSVFRGDGALLKAQDAYGNATNYSYDAAGNISAMLSPLGYLTSYSYDVLGRRTSVVAPDGATVSIVYNSLDLPISISDADGVVTSYQYDGSGHTQRIVDASSGETRYSFDSSGNNTLRSDANGGVVHRSYDALGRLISVEAGSISAVDGTTSFVYAKGGVEDGKLKAIRKGSVGIDYVYDIRGHVIDEIGSVDGYPDMHLGYEYEHGRTKKMIYPSGLAVVYTYNEDGDIATVATESDILFSNGQYGTPGQLRSYVSVGGLPMVRESDLSGKVVAVTQRPGAQPFAAATYSYDDVGRLTSERHENGAELSYSYSLGGDRKLVQSAVGLTTYQYAPLSHKLSKLVNDPSSFTTNLTYDNRGSITAIGSASFSYDWAGGLASIEGASSAAFSTDGLGRRVLQVGDTGVKRFAYDARQRVVSERMESGDFMETVFVGNIPVAVVHTSTSGLKQFLAVYSDAVGAPFALYDRQGMLRWRWSHDAFGLGEPETDPSALGPVQYDLRNPGQLDSDGSGLFYNLFRVYSPALGRYTQVDPIGQLSDLNPYVYAASDPVSKIDPLGLATFSGFQPWQERQMGEAIELAKKRLADCDVNGCDGLDRRDIAKILKTIDGANYVFSPELATCGRSLPLPFANDIHIGPGAFDYPVCCDLASTIAHEGSHLGRSTRGTEQRSNKVEIRCFGCPQIRQPQ